jgi:hypothetical protein
LRRSSTDPDDGVISIRPILEESGLHDRTLLGAAKRRLRGRRAPETSDWKREKYMRGDLATVDTTPFF